MPARFAARPIRFYALCAGVLVAGLFAIYGYHAHHGSGHADLAVYRDLGLLLLAVLLVFAVALRQLVVRPLQSLARHIDLLKDSSAAALAPAPARLFQLAEAERIRQSLDDYHVCIRGMRENLEKTGRELRALANHDALTGARNRKAFDEYLRELPAVLQERRISLSFVLFDVCRFKAINESYGHQSGDDVLKQVARRIGSVLRRGEHLFRVGGDEFVVLMLGTDEAGAQRFAERCLQELAAADYSTLGVREPVRVCVGIAAASFADPGALSDLQWRADVAMYNAKRPGSPGIVVFQADLAQHDEGILSNRINAAVCEAAMLGTGLTMFYQPVVDFAGGRILYYEALVRIEHHGEWLMPSTIFPVVQARHLEVDLDRAVLQQILQDLRAGRVQRGSGISINLAGPTLVNKNLPEWLAPFRPLQADYRVVLEIAESALITQIATAGENLVKLRAQGFEISLDDFGSGYSSFHYLASMPVSTVKFDISLIRNLGDLKTRRIVEHLVAMIGELGYQLVAEGVEDEDTLESVRQAGFTLGQGYLFGPPAQSAWRSDFEVDNLSLPHDAGGMRSYS
ncbi:MAG: bifunctional diguanylate cyclase/phosphodiesterase [Pseudomonadota bacterium]